MYIQKADILLNNHTTNKILARRAGTPNIFSRWSQTPKIIVVLIFILLS